MTKCLENFVSQTLGFITRFCAAELRCHIILNLMKMKKIELRENFLLI